MQGETKLMGVQTFVFSQYTCIVTSCVASTVGLHVADLWRLFEIHDDDDDDVQVSYLFTQISMDILRPFIWKHEM